VVHAESEQQRLICQFQSAAGKVTKQIGIILALNMPKKKKNVKKSANDCNE